MKNAVFALCLIAFGLTKTIAQEGIGVLVFGETFAEITSDLEKAIGCKTYSADNYDDYNKLDKETEVIIELLKSKTMRSFAYASDCDDSRVLFVKGYKIKDILIRDLTLTFYKDTLITIYLNPMYDFTNAFEAKYGKGDAKIVENKITCVYKLTGIKSENIETEVTTSWDIGRYHAFSTVSKKYNAKCELEYNMYFSFYNNDAIRDYHDCNSRGRKTIPKETSTKVDGF